MLLPKFKIGEKVVITKTNPGYTGLIIGILPTMLYFSWSGPDYAQETLNAWIKKLNTNLEILTNNFVYALFFENPVLPTSQGESIEKIPKVNVLMTNELDLEIEEIFWNNASKELGNLKNE